MELLTDAEKRADSVREIKGFENFSLIGVREQVKQMLALIGRADGVFATYTLHDISHIDAMLEMLDWIIPADTRESMTVADWLLVVLSIYFHDLGMVVSGDEFDNRKKNKEFCKWFESLSKSTEGRDYLARTKRMSKKEKDSFFFQEFVRMGHPERIAGWIRGCISSRWGTKVKVIAEAVAKLLADFPARFRDSLATVCESHHKENLDDANQYRLCEQCGGDIKQGVVNVQYAAIILRTVDLLHITQDRTPSIMYKVIGLTDPKAVTEWDKQRETFAVRPKAREFDVKNPDSSVILMCADFTKEEPLFALQQYITYANAQVHQSKRWADKSQQEADGKSYFFPWSEVRGDVRIEGEKPQPLKFELDRGRLLNLLVGHTIYNDATVGVRELLQNGIDAVRYQHYLDSRTARTKGTPAPAIGKVTVRWDPKERTLVIEDDGIGMDRDIIENHLMCVGASYYQTPKFRDEQKDFTPISRFGIGILTCFMISEDFEIVTYKDGQGHRIRMTTVEVDYLLRVLNDGDSQLEELRPHGTRVKLRVRDTVDLTQKSMEDIVRYWVIMPECAVEYVEEGKDAQQIGFDSPVEALTYYHKKEKEGAHDRQGWSLSKQSYVTKSREVSDGEDPDLKPARYELALCVEQRWTPERMFASRPKATDPAVCIEGIRVSSRLPWFSSDNQVSAILSVRGDQRFKTTVSREGLEIDEKYGMVGTQIAEMLFEHIGDEVERIAANAGSPLSQASSACYWLSERLLSACDTAQARSHVRSLRTVAPRMVIERIVNAEGSETKTHREMISQKSLADEKEVWSVESRLVDSLGTISRDLGRELSLNEFLLKLAPDLERAKHSPLLPDARMFSYELRESHRAELVEFSVQHQQSATKWVKRPTDATVESINLRECMAAEQWESYLDYIRSAEVGGMTYDIQVEICKINGDREAVDCVKTRLVPLFRKDSEIANTYGALAKAIRKGLSMDLPVDRFHSLFTVTAVFVAVSARGEEATGGYGLRMRDVYQIWQEHLQDAKATLKEANIQCDLPDDLKTFSKSVQRFDASSYWLDWWKREPE